MTAFVTSSVRFLDAWISYSQSAAEEFHPPLVIGSELRGLLNMEAMQQLCHLYCIHTDCIGHRSLCLCLSLSVYLCVFLLGGLVW